MSREVRQRWKVLQEGTDEVDLHVRLLSSFTIERLIPYVGVSLSDAGHLVGVEVAPYNQVVQECLDPTSATRTGQSDVVVVWSRLEQLWRGLPAPLDGPTDRYTDPLREVASAAVEASAALAAWLVFVLPAIPHIRALGVGDIGNPHGVAATASAAREACRRLLADTPGVLVVDAEEAVRHLGSDAALDHRLDYLADIPYREELFRLVADQIARCLQLATRPAPKVFAVDADNTLWAGEAADLGNIQLDGPAAAACLDLQRVLSDVRRAGALLALCSKNIEDDVRAALALPGMHLSWDDFSARSVGWDSKVEGLQKIAEELNLALDDFVFIDDSPAEIMEVSSRLPQVRTVLVPSDLTSWPASEELQRVLDRLPPTEDDMQRAGRYAAERQREAVQITMSEDEYRARLAPQVRIFEPTESDLPRFAQLLQRTNQFRLNTARYDESDLTRFASEDKAVLRLLEAWDSFGSYGVVGGAVLQQEGAHARLLAFAVSCRALGRGIEEAFLAGLARDVQEQWGYAIVAEAEDTGRNEPALRFFRNKGVEPGAGAATLRSLAWPAYVQHRP